MAIWQTLTEIIEFVCIFAFVGGKHGLWNWLNWNVVVVVGIVGYRLSFETERWVMEEILDEL